MTDFFADLEREIRAAHPRRPRPVVPVRGMAVSAVVATTLVAIVLGIGALTPTAEEVATQPTPGPEPTAVMPADCDGEVVDGRIPDEVVDRFAILRADTGSEGLPRERVPDIAAEVIRQSLRTVSGPGSSRYIFAVVRLGDRNCEPSDLGVCLIAAEDSFCTVLDDTPFLGYVVDDVPGDRRVVAIVAEDRVPRVVVSMDERGVLDEFDLESNVGFHSLPDGVEDVQVGSAGRGGGEEIIPLNCSNAPAMSELKERLAIFRRPPDGAPQGFEVELPKGWHKVYLDQMRAVGDDHFAFAANDATCATGVCIVAADDPRAACHTVNDDDEGAIVLTLTRRDGDRMRVAALVRDGVRAVDVTSDGRTREIPVRDNLVTFEASAIEWGVEPAS